MAPGGSEGRAVWRAGTAGDGGLEVSAAGGAGIVCSSDLGICLEMALAAFKKQILGSWKERANLMCQFQDKQRFTVISLSCGFLSFRFRYSCPAKILNGKFWKEIVLHSFSYNDPFSVGGLVCKLRHFPDLHVDNMKHSQGHSQLC